MHEYAKPIGYKIELENPAYEINQLNINLNSRNGTSYPYRKLNNKIKYIDFT